MFVCWLVGPSVGLIKEKKFQRSYYAATMKLVQIKDETSVEGKIRF